MFVLAIGACSTSIFGSGSDEAVVPGPGSSTRVIRTARPVLSSISISAPRRRTSPPATGNDAGRSRDEPIHDRINCAPQDGVTYRTAHARVAQESRCRPERSARRRSEHGYESRMTAETLPSRNRPSAIFSLVVSPCTSTMMVVVSLPASRHRCIDRTKRVFQHRLHKCARLYVDHADLPFVVSRTIEPAPRRAIGIIHRAQQTRLGVDEPHESPSGPICDRRGDD